MRPTQHRSNNAVLAAPPGVDREACGPLPITRVEMPDCGHQFVVSFWKPSAEERARIAAGMPVRVCVWGSTHPPLLIEVDGDGWI